MARTPIHPGEILSDELRELGMSAAELARLIHVPANRVSQILSGERNITADTALQLGRWFGTGPQLWLNLQQAYNLDLSWQRLGEELEAVEPRVQVAVNAVEVEDMAKPDDPQDGQ
jgi:antitoxin HigA-1